MTQQVLAKEDSALRSRKNSSHRVTQGMLTESHRAVSAVNSVKNSVRLCGKLFLSQQMQVI
jgi:hypothetical protein